MHLMCYTLFSLNFLLIGLTETIFAQTLKSICFLSVKPSKATAFYRSNPSKVTVARQPTLKSVGGKKIKNQKIKTLQKIQKCNKNFWLASPPPPPHPPPPPPTPTPHPHPPPPLPHPHPPPPPPTPIPHPLGYAESGRGWPGQGRGWPGQFRPPKIKNLKI